MEERTRNGRNITEKEQNVSGESMESRLRAAAFRIRPDEAARERIIEGVKTGRQKRTKFLPKIPAAVFAACLLFAFLCFFRPELVGTEAVIYAATEEHGWQKLVEGERIQLKMEPYQTLEEGEPEFWGIGYCTYYPYKCNFRVEVPESYLYDRQMVMIGIDSIIEYGDRIEWRVAPDRPEDAGKVRQAAFRLWIVDENLERQAALELELTKEDDKCYAELKRVWESKAYKKAKRRR